MDPEVSKMSLDTLEAIRTRRVAKWYADTCVPKEILWKVLEAARWAPTGGNRRKLRFVCITDRDQLRRIKMFSPGMVAGLPAALIVICIDRKLADEGEIVDSLREDYIDIGAAAENMLLAAHALGLAAGPMTSFSRDAVRVLLNLPGHLDPQMFIGLGYPAELPPGAPRWPTKKVHFEDFVQWGPFPDLENNEKTRI
jgi:nitroreductase